MSWSAGTSVNDECGAYVVVGVGRRSCGVSAEVSNVKTYKPADADLPAAAAAAHLAVPYSILTCPSLLIHLLTPSFSNTSRCSRLWPTTVAYG